MLHCVSLCFVARLSGLTDELLVMCQVRKVHRSPSWAANLEKQLPALGSGGNSSSA